MWMLFGIWFSAELIVLLVTLKVFPNLKDFIIKECPHHKHMHHPKLQGSIYSPDLCLSHSLSIIC